MPLTIPPAPPESIDPLRNVVPSLAHRPAMLKVAPRLSAALTSSSAPARLSPALSYRVYTLGLSDLNAETGSTLRGPAFSAWRHTLTSDGETVTADVSVDANGDFKFASLSSNPSAPGVENEIRALGQDPAIEAASYEVSLLQVPALGVRAVWLRDPSEKAPDILVPVAPVRAELQAGRRYSVAEFTAALKETAARILANDDPRKGS